MTSQRNHPTAASAQEHARRAVVRRRVRREQLATLSPSHERFRLYRVRELERFGVVEWLIDDYLAAGELTVFYGKGDTYKSFLALDWSCLLSRRGKTVVYIAAEGATGVRARVNAWMKHHGVESLPTLYFMPESVNVHRAAEMAKWLEAINAQLGGRKPDLVVIDTLARNFVGGSENDARDLGEFVDGIERIRRELGCAVLVIHHATKTGETERGVESLRNASFAMFRFERKPRSSATVHVVCDRMKDAERPMSRELTPIRIPLPELGPIASSLVTAWSRSRPNQDCERESRRELTREEAKLLRAIEGAKDGVNPADLADALKISRTSLRRLLNPLLDDELVRSQGQTRATRYFLTDSGRGVLE